MERDLKLPEQLAETDVDSFNKTVADTEKDHSFIEPVQTSNFVFVVCVVLVMFLLWIVIAFLVWKIQTGKRLNWKCICTPINELPTQIQHCRGYSKVAYSDDEESLEGSPKPNILWSLKSVKLAVKCCIRWLWNPISIIWLKCPLQMARRGIQRGLRNLGNTCYFNSVMQILANTYILRTSIQEEKHRGDFSRSFGDFCSWVIDRRSGPTIGIRMSGPHSGSKVYYPESAAFEQFEKLRDMHGMFTMRAPRFSDNGQHDSHECLRHVLDELRKDERDSRRKVGDSSRDTSLTVVDKVFGGHFITVYICKVCGSPYHLFEPFLDISLPIIIGSTDYSEMSRESTISRNLPLDLQEYAKATAMIMQRRTSLKHQFSHQLGPPYSISDCLWYFTRIEHIQDEYLCNHCSSKYSEDVRVEDRLTSATKQTLIFNPPAVLTIHLKRFEMKPGRTEKRRDQIKYTELLDIAPYCSEFCLRKVHPWQNLWYSLYGIVVHAGTLEFGHYVAYIKVRHAEPDIKRFLQEQYFDRDKTTDQLIEMIKETRRITENRLDVKPNEGVWYCMNDDWVSEVRIEEVLNQEAYLLLYERL